MRHLAEPPRGIDSKTNAGLRSCLERIQSVKEESP